MMAAATSPTAAIHADIVTRWIETQYQHCYGWLSFLSSVNGSARTSWVDLSAPLDLSAVLELAAHHDTWMGVATRRERLSSGRGTEEHCAEIPAVTVDIDILGPTHDNTDLPPDMAAARQLLASFPLQPTATIATGGGLQAWWTFVEPMDAAQFRPWLEAWGNTWMELGRRRGWHVDNTFDIARIMRIPGTLNHKIEGHPRPVVLEQNTTARYNPSDLEQHFLEPVVELQERAKRENVLPIHKGRPGDDFNARHTTSELLGLNDWTLARSSGNEEQWVRPGKSKRQGTGATVYKDDGHVTIWSSTPGLPVRRPMDAMGLFTHLYHRGVFADAARDLKRRGYGTPEVQVTMGPAPDDAEAPLEEPATPLQAAIKAEEQRQTLTDRMRSRLYRLDTGSFNIPEAKPLIDGVINEATLSVVYGAPKSAKSFLMLDQALHIATGIDWMGHTTQKGPVLYLLGEGVGGVNKRAMAWLAHHELAAAPNFHLLADTVRLLEDVELNALLGLIDEQPAKPIAIYIDTLARAMTGGEENDASSMGKLVHAADMIRNHTGATVTFVHHSGKDATKGSRGSTALLGALDTEFRVTKEGSKVVMTNTAQRDLEPLDDQEFEMVPAGKSIVAVWKCSSSPAPDAKDVEGRPAHLMARLSAFLEACHPLAIKQVKLVEQMSVRKAKVVDALGYLQTEGYIRRDVEPNAKGGAPSYVYTHVAPYDGVLRVGQIDQFPSVPISSHQFPEPIRSSESISSRSPMATGTNARELMNGDLEGEAPRELMLEESGPESTLEPTEAPPLIVAEVDDPFLEAAPPLP